MNRRSFSISCSGEDLIKRLRAHGSEWNLSSLTTENNIVYRLRKHRILVVYIPKMWGLQLYVSFRGSWEETPDGVEIKGSFLLNGGPLLPLLICFPVILALFVSNRFFWAVLLLLIIIALHVFIQHLIDVYPFKGKEAILSFFHVIGNDDETQKAD